MTARPRRARLRPLPLNRGCGLFPLSSLVRGIGCALRGLCVCVWGNAVARKRGAAQCGADGCACACTRSAPIRPKRDSRSANRHDWNAQLNAPPPPPPAGAVETEREAVPPPPQPLRHDPSSGDPPPPPAPPLQPGLLMRPKRASQPAGTGAAPATAVQRPLYSSPTMPSEVRTPTTQPAAVGSVSADGGAAGDSGGRMGRRMRPQQVHAAQRHITRANRAHAIECCWLVRRWAYPFQLR